MPSEPVMRLPYGPGWEDPDWSPQETQPESGPSLPAEAGTPMPVRTLAQFMDIVRLAVLRRSTRTPTHSDVLGRPMRVLPGVVMGSPVRPSLEAAGLNRGRSMAPRPAARHPQVEGGTAQAVLTATEA